MTSEKANKVIEQLVSCLDSANAKVRPILEGKLFESFYFKK